MNYPQEKYDEVRAATGWSMSNATIDLILSIFATVPQVTLEEATEIHDLYLRDNPLEASLEEDMRDAVNAVLAKQEPVIAAQPTVTLLDPTGGPTMEVPVGIVHEMDYPEAVTYTQRRVYGSEDVVCELCGAVVVDKVKHTDFHGRMDGK
jgi:hypothetical protein